MEPLSSFEELGRRFLLGELTEGELADRQQDVFSDQEKFYQLCEIEERLLEDYARGALTADQRQKFEQHYLSNPARRRRVIFAQTMAHEFQQQAMPKTEQPSLLRRLDSMWKGFSGGLQSPKFISSLAIAVLLVLLARGVWLWQKSEESSPVAQLETHPSPSPALTIANSTPITPKVTIPTPLPVSPPPATSSHEDRVVSLSLFAVALRSAPPRETKLILQHDTTRVRVRIGLPLPQYPRYAVRLQGVNEQEVFAQENLKTIQVKDVPAIILNIPASRLQTGSHLLTIEGVTESGEHEPISKQEIQVTRK